MVFQKFPNSSGKAWGRAGWPIILAVFSLLPCPASFAASAQPASVVIAPYKGMISHVTASYFRRALKLAEEKKAEVLVLELDTPGGLMDSMRDMIQDMLASPVPVVVYVYPQGARAASAGTFLTMASDLAVMAPNTNLGAAHPVDSQGHGVSEKITNDAAAYIMTLAAQKSRNVAWAEKAVRQSVSVGEQDALKQKIVDMVVQDEKTLLQDLDGREIKKNGLKRDLRIKDASILRLELNARENFLLQLADPTLAYVLFLVGLYALIFEVTHPGVALPGISGVICLILAVISFGSLPVNYGALALLAFGVGLFAVEAFVVSHGVLAVGGAIAMFLGSILLYDSSLPGYRLSIWVILLTVGVTAGFFLLVLATAIRALRKPAMKDPAALIGKEGAAKTDLNPDGMVHLDSEDWTAAAEDGLIPAGSRIKVVEIQGLKLKVRKI